MEDKKRLEAIEMFKDMREALDDLIEALYRNQNISIALVNYTEKVLKMGEL